MSSSYLPVATTLVSTTAAIFVVIIWFQNTGAAEIMQHADELQVGGQSPGGKKF